MSVLEGIRFQYLLFPEMNVEFFSQLLFVKIIRPPQSLIFLNNTFLEKLDGEKCYWVYSTWSVEFHQKEKVWYRKLGTIRKKFLNWKVLSRVKKTPNTSKKKNKVSKLSFKTLEVQSLWIINL